MKKINLIQILLSLTVIQNAYALNPILRPFHSVRAAGMGDVRYTTGLYEENFYANPARVTENPENLFQLPKISVEVGSNTLGSISNLTKSNSGLSGLAADVGKPISGRFQLLFPAYYNTDFITNDWAFGIGMLESVQFVPEISQAATIDPTFMVSAGPAITLGRRLLEEDRLSVGATLHTEVRGTSKNSLTLTDFLKGTDVSNALKGGSGMGFDFDLGTTFKPHWNLLGWDYQVGFAINNLLGGQYKNLNYHISNFPSNPLQTPRSYNFGVSAVTADIPFFDDIVVALESTDIGNNVNGSFYRTLHLGTEAYYGVLAFRLGINQGYFCGGLGVDVGWFDLNVATYGEEVGLNAGDMQDRRYALELGFQI